MENTMVIGDNGELYACGGNWDGQLGDGTTDDSITFEKITLESGVKCTQVVSGEEYSMAIGDNGELYTWGYNGDGELGDGTTTRKLTPTKIELANGIKIKQIACGYFNSMAIGSDGELYTWGTNDYGQLGDGTTDNRHTPTKITLANGIKPAQIACGWDNSMSVGDDGNLYTWGDNSGGMIGDNTIASRTLPTKINLELALNPTTENNISHLQIKSLVSNIGSSSTAFAINSNDDFYGWGRNWNGQIGDGTTTRKNLPTKIMLPNEVKPIQIASGVCCSMAIGDDGELYTWGSNSRGSLGNGATTNVLTPTKITLASGVNPTQISAENNFSLAFVDDNYVYAWGR